MRVRRTWTAISELAEKRRRLASAGPGHPPGQDSRRHARRAPTCWSSSHFEELHEAIERDLVLRAELKDIDAALERALMYLHEQRVIVLQQAWRCSARP